MQEFTELLEIANKLNSPGGCPWDLVQTFDSLKPYVIEEAHEVVEAVEKGDIEEIKSELGDLLYTVIFYAKVAERDKLFTLAEILSHVSKKLVHRHPHVFGDLQINTLDELEANWDKLKQKETLHQERSNALDGIPKSMPALMKGKKMLKRIKKSDPAFFATLQQEAKEDPLLHAVFIAIEKDFDAEEALRNKLYVIEERFRGR